LFAAALRRADRVLVQNRQDGEHLRRTLQIDAEVIPNAHVLPPVPALKQPREIVLWVGRSAPVKQPGEFLRLAEAFPKVRFVMICARATGDTRFAELEERARALPQVEFIPGVPYRRAADYFHRARVFVNTSRGEGFPNTFIQAGAAAVPILSLVVDPDGFLERYDCGRCAGGRRERLVELLTELLDPGTARRLGDNARRYVE